MTPYRVQQSLAGVYRGVTHHLWVQEMSVPSRRVRRTTREPGVVHMAEALGPPRRAGIGKRCKSCRLYVVIIIDFRLS